MFINKINKSNRAAKIIPLQSMMVSRKDDVEVEEATNHKEERILKNKLFIANQTKVTIIDISTILYCKACSNYTEIYTADGKSHLLSKTLRWVEDKIQSRFFLRTHQSYLINAAFISSILKNNGYKIEILNSTQLIPVSRRNHSLINEIIGE